MSKKNKKILFGVLGLVVAVVVLALLYINFRPQPKDAGGSKTITLTVVFADESTKEFTIKTNEDFLRGALEQENLIAGDESDWGLYVKTVAGVTADDSANGHSISVTIIPRQALIQHRSTMVTPLSS